MTNLLALLALLALDQGPAGWHQSRAGSGYELAFGDQAEILFQCVPGRRTVRVNVDGLYTGDGPEPRRLLIRSGRSRTSVPLRYDGNQARGGAFMADVPAGSPALLAFARTGRLTLRALNGEVDGNAGSAADRATIARFFASCRWR